MIWQAHALQHEPLSCNAGSRLTPAPGFVHDGLAQTLCLAHPGPPHRFQGLQIQLQVSLRGPRLAVVRHNQLNAAAEERQSQAGRALGQPCKRYAAHYGDSARHKAGCCQHRCCASAHLMVASRTLAGPAPSAAAAASSLLALLARAGVVAASASNQASNRARW